MLLSNAVNKTTETAAVSSSGKPEFAPSSQSLPHAHSQDSDRLVVWQFKMRANEQRPQEAGG